MTLFPLQIYQTNLGEPDDVTTPLIAQVRVSPTALTLTIEGTANVPPTAYTTVNTNIPVRVSKKRAYGITARHIILTRLGGVIPNQYIVRRRIVMFDLELFEATISSLNNQFSYEGQTDWILAGAANECYHLFSGAAPTG
jgi:hypothetical protein